MDERQIDDLLAEAKERIVAVTSERELEAQRVRWLGRKSRVAEALRGLGEVEPGRRRALGAQLNAARQQLAALIAERREVLAESAWAAAVEAQRLDVTLPGRAVFSGGLHPLRLAERSMVGALQRLGFAVAEGPEIESEYLNFEALNMPQGHPARDMQDTFYLSGRPAELLRTQTSPVQIRSMHSAAPRPLRVIAPGRVYRRDDDATHSPVFHQIEGLALDEQLGMQHLKGTLHQFARMVFGAQVRVRLRPSYFPFTEPSAELDVSCVFCGGSGCRVCKQSGFIEILGCGMVHPHVLREGGYDPERFSGFAFGMGIERVAMLRYRIDDIRLLYQSDLRFLGQF